MGANPPIVAFAPGDQVTGEPKDTAQNIQETKEFVVNLVDESIAEKMNLCSATLAPDSKRIRVRWANSNTQSVGKTTLNQRSSCKLRV